MNESGEPSQAPLRGGMGSPAMRPEPFRETAGAAQKLRALREFLALERNVAVLVGAVLIVGMGEQLWAPFVAKYLRVLGASVIIVGFFGTLETILDAVYQYPGGVISDRLGCRRSLVLFNLMSATVCTPSDCTGLSSSSACSS